MAAALNRCGAVDGEGLLQGDVGRLREDGVRVERGVLQRGLGGLGTQPPLQKHAGQRAAVQIDCARLAVQRAAVDRRALQ